MERPAFPSESRAQDRTLGITEPSLQAMTMATMEVMLLGRPGCAATGGLSSPSQAPS